jgi:hypothetical protein
MLFLWDADAELLRDIFNRSLPFCTALSMRTVELIDEPNDSFRVALILIGLEMDGDWAADECDSSVIGFVSNFVEFISSFTGVTDFFGLILRCDPHLLPCSLSRG